MNTTHFHLFLNHVPVLGTAFGLLILLIGGWRKSDELKKAALILFAVTTLVAVPHLARDDGGQHVPGVYAYAAALVVRVCHCGAIVRQFCGAADSGASMERTLGLD